MTTRCNQFLNLAMQDEKCRAGIKGASYQWAGKFGVIQAKEDYPELDTIMSEWECGDGKNTWTYAMYGFEMFRHYFAHGVRACVYWNIALDHLKKSTWGRDQNSLINVIDGEVIYNPDYYMVKHFAYFVKKGAVMLETKSSFNTNTAVFKNPDGSRVAVLMNPFEFEKVVTIEGKNYRLAPVRSIPSYFDRSAYKKDKNSVMFLTIITLFLCPLFIFEANIPPCLCRGREQEYLRATERT